MVCSLCYEVYRDLYYFEEFHYLVTYVVCTYLYLLKHVKWAMAPLGAFIF